MSGKFAYACDNLRVSSVRTSCFFTDSTILLSKKIILFLKKLLLETALE
jgi:hypothetical protein